MKALLLIGSPKKRSSSQILGQALLAGLTSRGWEAGTLRLAGLLEGQGGKTRLLMEYAAADLVILAAPVYVDAPPAPVMRAMEFLAGEPGRADGESAGKPRRLAAIFNCGFPEASHTDICLSVCRLFAREAGLVWAGGLGVGGGGAIDGKPLSERGKLLVRLSRALELASRELASGRNIPEEAVRLAAAPAFPRFLYYLFAEAGWIGAAWRYKTLSRLGRRPFPTR